MRAGVPFLTRRTCRVAVRSRPDPSAGPPVGRPQAMAVGDQDHGGVAVAVAVALGGVDQPLDFGLGQVLAACAARRWPPSRA